ncbi:MAG: type I-U CRISPR-associated protein Csb2 [Actinomycetia bacterium]|nr:type I-U CRISPR-associated protein Csb2 [Actinomycetes bacterium]
MLVFSVEFLHGTFRADPDGLAHTGRMSRGEWPPAPSRVYAALIAADGTGERCRVTSGVELEFLEQLDPPVICADPSPVHQRLQTRYVVRYTKTGEKNTHQEYVAREGTPVHPGVRVSLRYPRVLYRYEVDAPSMVVDALRKRAARVGYLGAADSPVRMRVLTQIPDAISGGEEFVPDPGGDIRVSVPRPGHGRIWDSLYEAWCERGAAVGRSQYPALRHQVAYRLPGTALDEKNCGSVVAWLRLSVPVSGRRIATVASLFKKSVLARYEGIHGEPPAVLHGHGFDRQGYELARFLALPDVGYRHSRSRIHGLAVWLPPNLDPDTERRVRDAARSVRRLVGAGLDIAVHPWEGEKRPRAAHPDRWTQRSTRWATAFPAIHERHGPVALAEVARWCANAGLPEPVAFRSDRRPLIDGAVDLAPAEVHRPNRPGRPYSHVELVFPEPVSGPVVIGAGRQRGFGLCVPVSDKDPVRQEEPSGG